jgi:predicted pyridoxine 5'-phosphate oxidase superfamily flavin-nucleotide-binding protein
VPNATEEIAMTIEYNSAARKLQDQHDTRRMADRIAEFAPPMITPEAKDMIESQEMFFLATCDDKGQPQVSYKGGPKGFVRVVDDVTLAFPLYDGNGMFLSAGNMITNRNVGMLFVDFLRPYRFRVNGEVSVDQNDPLLMEYPEAQMIFRVKVREAFGNCPRYVHKMQMVENSKFVPKTNVETPIAKWKFLNVMQDVLPDRDRKAVDTKLAKGEKIIEADFEKPIRDQI